MIPGQMFTDPQGRVLQFTEARRVPVMVHGLPRGERVRYTFLDVDTRQYVDLWDRESATLTPVAS